MSLCFNKFHVSLVSHLRSLKESRNYLLLYIVDSRDYPPTILCHKIIQIYIYNPNYFEKKNNADTKSKYFIYSLSK